MSIITGQRLNYFYKKISDIFAKKSVYSDSNLNLGRKDNSVIGERSAVVGGLENTASGTRSVVVGGYNNVASSVNSAVLGGYGNTASGSRSAIAGGYENNANSDYSAVVGGHGNSAKNTNAVVVGGYNNYSQGSDSAIVGGHENNIIPEFTDSVIVGGYLNDTRGTNSVVVCGYNASALGYQLVTGHYNNTSLATTGCNSGAGSGTALCIGNGTSSAASNAIRVDYNGKVWCKKAYSSTGADYAELFEWLDGNPDNEDRRGYFVTMDGDKIKKASKGDWILGIVSANPCVLGNTDMEWQGQFLKDEFGDFIIEDGIDIVKEKEYRLNEKGEPIEVEVEREVPYQFYKVNPDYNPDEEYIFRLDRKEWDAVGMVGVLAVRDDGTCQVNGFCSCNDNGIATTSEIGYRVIRRINHEIIKVVVK